MLTATDTGNVAFSDEGAGISNCATEFAKALDNNESEGSCEFVHVRAGRHPVAIDHKCNTQLWTAYSRDPDKELKIRVATFKANGSPLLALHDRDLGYNR